jgi:hypothetical protein
MKRVANEYISKPSRINLQVEAPPDNKDVNIPEQYAILLFNVMQQP